RTLVQGPCPRPCRPGGRPAWGRAARRVHRSSYEPGLEVPEFTSRGSRKRTARLETPPGQPDNDSSMQHHWVVPLVAAAANSVICVLVLRGGLRRPITRVFAWMTFTTILWNLDIFALYYFADPVAAERWSRIFRTGMCFSAPALLHAGLVQSESRGRGWVAALVISYLVAAGLAAANLRGDLVAGLDRH